MPGWHWLMPSSTFRVRIIVTFTVITALVVTAISLVSHYSVRRIYSNQLYEQTRLLTQLVGSNLSPRFLTLLPTSDQKSLTVSYYQNYLQTQVAAMGLQKAFVFDNEYTVIAHSDSSAVLGAVEPQLLISRSEIEGSAIRETALSTPFKGRDGAWYLWGFYRIDAGHWLGIQESAARFERIEALARIFWAIGFGGVVVTIAAGWMLARSIAAPVDRLVKFSEALGQGHFDAPPPEGIEGELAALTQAMNRMRGDIAQKHRDKEEMLAQIAHEIRNPLGGIELLAGLIAEDGKTDEQTGHYAQKILDEIGGLKSLINAFLQYSKPLKPKPEQVDLVELIDEVRLLMSSEIEDKAFTLECNGAVSSISFDPQHLRQIVLNLVSNSLEAGENGGRISISCQKQGDKIQIRIADNGPGIPEENRDAIFEPFFTTRKGGTGLGLAICKKLCRENHATLSLIAEDGPGVAFVITKAA